LENEIKETLINPVEIKKSSSDENVFLYYSNYMTNYLCIVARHLNEDGFIVTMYITGKIKKGETIWTQ